MTELEQAARQLLIDISVGNPTDVSLTTLREALDNSATTGNMAECRHCGFLCKPSTEEYRSWYPLKQPKFIPVGIVNDHHSITWMEEIVDDQAPIGAILYALQDSVGRNVSFAKEQK